MGSKTILVIEDDESIQTFVSMVLVDEGYDVVVARDGQQALQLLTTQTPALILLDLRMPNIDGWAFIQAYRQMPVAQVPIVVMTAGRSTSDTLADLEVTRVLAKPFALNELLHLVDEHTQTE
jgi:DNA-binding response OmpR family regulator